MKLSIDQVRDLAKCERMMDSGEYPFVNGPSGRLMVSSEVMDELGLVTGQTISFDIMGAILEAHLASIQARIALDKAVSPDAAK